MSAVAKTSTQTIPSLEITDDWELVVPLTGKESAETESRLSVFDPRRLNMQAYLFTFTDVSELYVLNFVSKSIHQIVEKQTLFPLIRAQFNSHGVSLHKEACKDHLALRTGFLKSWSEASTSAQNLQLDHDCLTDKSFEVFGDRNPIPSPTFAHTLISDRDFADKIFAIRVSSPRTPLATVCQNWDKFVRECSARALFNAAELKIVQSYVSSVRSQESEFRSAVSKWGMFLDGFLQVLRGEKIPDEKKKEVMIHLARHASVESPKQAFARLVYHHFRFRDPAYLERQLLVLLRLLPKEKRVTEAVVYEVREFMNMVRRLNSGQAFLIDDHLQALHSELFFEEEFIDSQTKLYNMKAAVQLLQDFGILKRWTPVEEEEMKATIEEDWVSKGKGEPVEGKAKAKR